MKTLTLTLKNTNNYIKELITDIIFTNVSLPQSTKIEIQYELSNLSEFEIIINSQNVWDIPEYNKIPSRSRVTINSYFEGLVRLSESGESIDSKVAYFNTNIMHNIDDNIRDTIFENSDSGVARKIGRVDMSVYLFMNNEEVMYIVDEYGNIDTIEEGDSVYRYLMTSFSKHPMGDSLVLLSYNEYIYSHYKDEIKDFKKFLSRYTERNLFDEHHVRDRASEDEYVFSSYSDMIEEERGGYVYLIRDMYEQGKIPLTLNIQLEEISEEDYDNLIQEFRGNLLVSLNRPNEDDNHIIDAYYPANSFIYIDTSDISKISDDCELYSWLTKDILYDLIKETKSLIDDDDFWETYISRKRDYEYDIDTITCYLYLNYEETLNTISDFNFSSDSNKKGKMGKISRLLDTESNPDKDIRLSSFEKKIKTIKDDTIYRVASLLGKHLDYDLTKVITLKDFKKISNSDKYLKRLLPTKEVNSLLNTFTKGFSINDLKQTDTTYEKGSLFEYLVKKENIKLDDFLDVDIVSYKWKSSLQTITNKYNYVFQLNLKKEYFNKILDVFNVPEENRKSLSEYHIKKHTLHPVQNNERYISLGWIRYTVNPTIKYNDTTLDGVLLDEVQSDLDNFEYLGRDIMKGWQNIIVRKFISYVRKNLGYSKIYMPTPDVKADKYNAFQRDNKGEIVQKYTANLLYKQLPSNFAFLPSEVEGFNLLEKIKTMKIKLR